ncbi:MAG: bifunctional 23S rRNA (guanine(2069)-N(7))-methyltransferase RlmK/23S rRNA (guanine(2445)-N(2))-methyltransferase RlmL [Phycisphaeraceae bacterium]|nr:MAG: bifunctional 23S rRNA (guanine(2069)-N(7))-methyltransferase RlmK/23S rRNA (guanine(2445)-N(2))-methyltransferase RlmL [Phycisphaeraceae bacterium]
METYDLIAVTAFGLESVVVRELSAMGIEAKAESTGRVAFRGGVRTIADVNLWLRTADRVLIRAASFPCEDFDTLFDAAGEVPWERWVGPGMRFVVNGRSVKSRLSSVPALQRTVKKAMVGRLMRAHRVGTLPETGARFVAEVSLLGDVATLTVDTSGEGLHKRGYRDLVGEAPLKETLAAGLVLLSVWNPERPLIDPFCGSGTIAIEAALIGRGIAPGAVGLIGVEGAGALGEGPSGRARRYDAEFWADADAGIWREAREAAVEDATGRVEHPIHGFDLDETQVTMARRHAARAGVADVCRFQVRDFRDLSSRLEYGVTIMNPPYGDRAGLGREVEDLYRAFPEVLRRLPTWSHHVLTSWDDFERLVGQPATRRRKLYNAQIQCMYYQFLGPRPPAVAPASGVEGEHPVEADAVPAPGEGEASASPASFGGLRPRDLKEVEEFAACLANNARHLRKYPARGITCYRLYERDCPDVPVIVDRYEDALHVQEYEREHGRTAAQHGEWIDAVCRRAADVCGVAPRRVYFKRKDRQRGTTQHEKRDDRGEIVLAREGGLTFEVNLSDYTDTGLFLDHRLTRAMVRDEAAGRRFLNLFCYTGSFTVYAAHGGASGSTSVDLSNTYLSWAGRNLERNGLSGASHRLERADVMAWVRSQRPGPAYDLAVIDPPTFSNSRMTEDVFDVQRDHAELLGRTLGQMAPGGVVYFSTNFRGFEFETDAVRSAAGEAGGEWAAKEISGRTVPPEYRNRRIHRCWRIVRG